MTMELELWWDISSHWELEENSFWKYCYYFISEMPSFFFNILYLTLYLHRIKIKQYWDISPQSSKLTFKFFFQILFDWKQTLFFFRKESYLIRLCPGSMNFLYYFFFFPEDKKNVIFKESSRWHLWCIQ